MNTAIGAKFSDMIRTRPSGDCPEEMVEYLFKLYFYMGAAAATIDLPAIRDHIEMRQELRERMAHVADTIEVLQNRTYEE